MNGLPANWLTHVGIALAIMAVFALWSGEPLLGAAAASLWAYAKEIGEQSVRHHWTARTIWTDINPLHPNWSRDDRLDLACPVAAVWLAALILAIL